MKTNYINVDDKWGIVMVWDYDEFDDKEMYAIMDSFGLDDYDKRKALNILQDKNTGMAVSRSDIRMSVIFISNATSISQWISTLVHELKHCLDAILDYYDIESGGEESAYTIGYLTQRAIEEICVCCV